MPVLQLFISHILFIQPLRCTLACPGFNLDVTGFHPFCDGGLLHKHYMPYCTTKYIFKLGKNKFD